MERSREFIEDIELALPLLADIAHSEILLLKLREGKEMEVIAHSKPSTAPFIYRRSRMGELISPDVDSLPFLAYQKGRLVKGMEGEMVRGIPVWRWASPLYYEGKLIGILEVEQNLLQRRMRSSPAKILRQIAILLNRTFFRGQFDEKVLIQILKQGDGKVLRKDGKIIYADERARAIYRKLGIRSPSRRQFVEEELEGAIKLTSRSKGIYNEQEIQFGSTIILKREAELLDSYSLSILCDISLLRRRMQEKMLRSEVIQEMHHHIKNILQTIMSMLRMQMRRLNDEVARSALEDAINRLSSIATVHDLLSEEGIAGVDFRELAERITQSAKRAAGKPEVNVHLEGLSPLFPPQVVSLIGLILNELVQNAFHHAFEDGGNLWVKLEEKDDKLVLEVVDDGVGFKEDIPFGLGLSIVKGLAEELGGRFEIEGGRGTRARVLLPKEVAIWELEY
ncbi:histidine kinase N-terminal domain-containing protein [bacterium]|nr:histidine kinase N-terminal domain-containing protein [bacterium]